MLQSNQQLSNLTGVEHGTRSSNAVSRGVKCPRLAGFQRNRNPRSIRRRFEAGGFRHVNAIAKMP